MLFICHFSELSEGNVRMMAYQLSLSLPVLISHYLSPHTPCTRHMGLPLLLTFSTYTCPLPGPSHWPFQCPGRLFPHSHTVRGLLRSGLRPVLRPPLTTLWSSGHMTPHSAPWFRIVFVSKACNFFFVPIFLFQDSFSLTLIILGPIKFS